MFKGLGNIGNLASMMGAMKELPEKVRDLNARMQDEHVSGKSSCGRVTVTVNCVGQVQSVAISEENIPNAELEPAIVEATNQAGATAKQTYGQAIRDLVAEMNIDLPGVDGFLTSLTGGG